MSEIWITQLEADLMKKCKELEEENETLKDNVEFLHSCLDDRGKSIAIMQEENKNLKEEISSLRIELEQEKWKTGKKWTPATPYI